VASFSLLFAVTLGRAEFNLDSQGIIVESVCVCVTMASLRSCILGLVMMSCNWEEEDGDGGRRKRG
jgi:hypothetical protein